MKTILIITLFSWIIYKAGCVKWLLNAAVIQEPEPVKRSYRKPPQQIQEPQKIIIVYESRTQLETRAANIMTAAGVKNIDVWGHVRTLTNEELNEIITNGY